MLGTPSMRGPLRGLVQRVQDWPVASQQQARRNAMVAATACAQRRSEREDVADFLHALIAPPATSAGRDATHGVSLVRRTSRA